MNKKVLERALAVTITVMLTSGAFFVFIDPESAPLGRFSGAAIRIALTAMALSFLLGAMHLMAVSMELYDESFLSAIKTHSLNAFLSFIFIIISISLLIYFIFL